MTGLTGVLSLKCDMTEYIKLFDVRETKRSFWGELESLIVSGELARLTLTAFCVHQNLKW